MQEVQGASAHGVSTKLPAKQEVKMIIFTIKQISICLGEKGLPAWGWSLRSAIEVDSREINSIKRLLFALRPPQRLAGLVIR